MTVSVTLTDEVSVERRVRVTFRYLNNSITKSLLHLGVVHLKSFRGTYKVKFLGRGLLSLIFWEVTEM